MPAAAGSPVTATLAVANCFLVVDDHEAALTFYRDVLGFTVTQDVSMGEYRWLSVSTPTQPELEITIQSVGGGPGHERGGPGRDRLPRSPRDCSTR